LFFFVRIGKSDSDRAKKGKGVFNEASANKEFSPQAMYNLTHFLEKKGDQTSWTQLTTKGTYI
jgi:hypothetical protein